MNVLLFLSIGSLMATLLTSIVFITKPDKDRMWKTHFIQFLTLSILFSWYAFTALVMALIYNKFKK